MTLFELLQDESEAAGQDLSWPRFVQRFFIQIGAETELQEDGLLAVLTEEQRRLLEGRPRSLFDWSWSHGVAPPEQPTVLRLLFRNDSSSPTDPAGGAELCVPGSFRGRQITDAALRLWPVGRLFVAPGGEAPGDALATEPGRRWRPYLVFHFRLTFIAQQAGARDAAIAVDLVSGAAAPWPALSPRRDAVPVEPPGPGDERGQQAWREIPSEPARLNVGEALRRAMQRLQTDLAAAGDDWAVQGRRRLAEDAERLRAYLRRAELEEDAESLRELRAARLEELQRRGPRVEVDVAALTVVHALDRGKA